MYLKNATVATGAARFLRTESSRDRDSRESIRPAGVPAVGGNYLNGRLDIAIAYHEKSLGVVVEMYHELAVKKVNTHTHTH